MDVLKDCEKNLLTSWGMSPEAIEAIGTQPKSRNGIRIFSSGDYPQTSIRNEEQGTTGVRFWVGKNGRVRDCVVVETSGSAALDAQTCSVITTRARYDPAVTKNGEAVDSLSYSRIRWVLPDD
jgi:protein TonB